MKFSIGDKVKFLNENMEGIVSSIIDQLTLGITVNNDFEIPVQMKELVKISFDEFRRLEASDKPVVPKTAEVGFDENMYVSFVQLNELQMELYFINHTKEKIFVNYYTKKQDSIVSKFFQTIEAYDYRSIDKFPVSEFTNWPELYFQVTIKPEDKELQPIVKNLQLPASRFFKHLRATPLLNKQGYLFLINSTLKEEDIQKLTGLTIGNGVLEETEQIIRTPLQIIDLHIDKIHANYTQLTKQETLQIQINYFEKNFEDAMAAGMNKITFIHGVGNLKLKNEILKVLKTKSGIAAITDAPINEFGYGATAVLFSQS